MADPDTSAGKKSVRKRRTALLEPEEVTADILDELQRSRNGIDKKLAKYNDAFMQIQVRARQQFIEKCATRIRNLDDSVRPIVVVQLLSSEDFVVEMNFSELHTSSSKSLLTWSCTDGTLSESSWKAVLQQCAEGASTSSSRTTRASHKGSSPPTPSSIPNADPPGHPTSTTLPETRMTTSMLIENEGDDVDLLAISDVTISRHGKARVQESPAAPLTSDSPSIREQRAPDCPETLLKRRSSRIPRWSKQECDTLRNLCDGKDKPFHHITMASPLWENVSAHLPGRTSAACFMKWKQIRRKARKKKPTDSPAMRDGGGVSTNRWSEEELKKLAQCCSQLPRAAVDWALVAAQIPGRTGPACESQYQRRFRGTNFEILDETLPQGVPIPAANGELVQGNMTFREGEKDDRKSLDGESAALL